MNSFFDVEMADSDDKSGVESVVIHEDSSRGEYVAFGTDYCRGVAFRRWFKAPTLAPDQLSDLTREELVFIAERKMGTRGNVRVSYDHTIGTVHIESVGGTPPSNRLSFPIVCYTKLRKAICSSLDS